MKIFLSLCKNLWTVCSSDSCWFAHQFSGPDLSVSPSRGWSWRSSSSSSSARRRLALCPSSLIPSPLTSPHLPPPPLLLPPPRTRPRCSIYPPPDETPALLQQPRVEVKQQQMYVSAEKLNIQTWYCSASHMICVTDFFSPGTAVPRRLRGPGPCRRLRVIPDLVVMGEGGVGRLAGWTFTPRWESAHHSVAVRTEV